MTNLQTELLDILRKDCRISLEKLAKMCDVSVSEVADCIHEMEQNKVILRYCPIINWDRTEREYVEAIIELRISPQKECGFDSLARQLYQFPEVKSLYLMSGQCDLLLLVEAKDLKTLAMLVSERLSTLDSIISTSTSFILKRYKSEGVVFDEEHNKDSRLVVSP